MDLEFADGFRFCRCSRVLLPLCVFFRVFCFIDLVELNGLLYWAFESTLTLYCLG